MLSVFTLFTSKILLASFCLMLYFLDLDEFSSLVIREENNNNYNGFYCNELPVLEENFLLEDKPFIKESYDSSLEDSSFEDSSFSSIEENSGKTLYEGFKETLNDINDKNTSDYKYYVEPVIEISDKIVNEVRRATVVNFDDLNETQKQALKFLKETYNKKDNFEYWGKDISLTDYEKASHILFKESYYNNNTCNNYLTFIEVLKDGVEKKTIAIENTPIDAIERKDPTFAPNIYVLDGHRSTDFMSEGIDLNARAKPIEMKSYADAVEYINESKEITSKSKEPSSLEVSPKTKSELWTPKLPQESFNDSQDKSLWKDNLNTPEQKLVENLKPSPVRDSTIESITKDNNFKEKLDKTLWMEKESYNLDSLFDEKKD